MTATLGHGVIVCFATQGSGHSDERRIRSLLSDFEPDVLAFDRSAKLRSMIRLLWTLYRRRPELVVMEGTGLAGGLVLIALPRRLGVRYVVSSGDAVGPYLAMRHRLLGPVGALYERLLVSRSSGVIGWTPYLVGRALTLGAPRAMTAAGWASRAPAIGARQRWRERYGIAPDAIVFGLVGSLNWRCSVGYAYGLELVRAVRRSTRPDVCVCIVGEGAGRERLAREAGDEIGRRISLPGAVAADDVPDVLASFDVASLPQSVDRVGSFRFTTKLSEYLAAGLPIVTGQIPLAYDLDSGWIWRLPGNAPWDETYVRALSELMNAIGREDIAHRMTAARAASALFDVADQRKRVTAFIEDIVAVPRARHRGQ